MHCQVCLKKKRKLVDMDSAISLHLNIAQILHKHLLFLPEEKEMSCDVCNDCWLAVSSFHEFYVSVEKAHSQLMQQNLCAEVKTSNNDRMCEQIVLNEVKCEPSEVLLTMNEDQETQESSLCDPLISEPRRSKRVNLKPKPGKEQSTTKISMDATDEFQLKEGIVGDDCNGFMDCSIDEKCIDIDSEKILLDSPLTESTYSTTNNFEIKTTNWEPVCHIEEKIPTNDENRLEECVSNGSEDDEDNEADKDEDSVANGAVTEESEDVDTFIAKNIKMICEMCQEKHPTIRKLKDHMEFVHHVKGYVRCCGKKLFSRYYLLEHIEKHNNKNYFKCHDCGKQFTSHHCLKNHMMRKHGKLVEKTYNCDQCEKSFKTYYMLGQHRLTKHQENATTCGMCEVSFPDTSALKKHVDDKHRCAPYMCDMCGKLFKGTAAFETHKKEHLGVALPRLQCPKCNAWLKNKSSLGKHMRRHGDGKMYPCNICGKELSSHPALLRHNRDVHAPPKHECCVCKKAFRKLLHLREHMTRHTGEALYQCEFCPKKFSFNASMCVHRKTMHPKEYEVWLLKRRELAALPVTIPQMD